jgi:hypothetical protein
MMTEPSEKYMITSIHMAVNETTVTFLLRHGMYGVIFPEPKSRSLRTEGPLNIITVNNRFPTALVPCLHGDPSVYPFVRFSLFRAGRASIYSVLR